MHFKKSMLFLVYFIATMNSIPTSMEKTLEMVHLVYRHGARAPEEFYPTNPIQGRNWPDGGGSLTKAGMRGGYELGQFLRERYVQNMSFLNSEYIENEVYIRSSDVNRCLQSAEVQVAGLYPPKGRQIWNQDIAWQPIPIHTVGDPDTFMRPDESDCPRRDEIMAKKEKADAYKKKADDYKELFAKLSKHAGMEVTIDNIYIIADDYLCEKAQGYSSPQWVKDNIDDILALYNWRFLYLHAGDDENGKILGGPFLGFIEENMKKMRKNDDSSMAKMRIFSGHDTTILSLMSSLDIDLGTYPAFDACFIIELYSNSKNQYFVEMKYRNDTSNNLVEFSLNGCSQSCPLDDFVRLTAKRVTSNQQNECAVVHDGSHDSDKNEKSKSY